MKRLKKILKWIGIATGAVIAVLLMLDTYYVWSTGTRLERRLGELRSAGEPVQLADLAREPIPPETNAETFLRRTDADLDSIQKELMALSPKTGSPTGTPSPAEREKLEKLFAAFPKVMPLLEQAADCPDYDPQIDFTLPPSPFVERFMESTAKHRRLARVLRALTSLRLSQVRPDDAVATQLLTLRLARKWRRRTMLIGYFLTIACQCSAMEGVNQVLQAGPISPSTRQALDAELALHDNLEGLRWALQGERAFSLSSVRELLGTGYWPPRVFTNDVMLRFLDLFDHHVRSTSRPYSEAVSRKYSDSSRGGLPNPWRPLVTLLDPAMISARQVAERPRAMARSLRVLNALLAREPADSDGIPDLASLGLPPEATIDPFNGQPLHVKKRPEGWMVYSVGYDGVDDGGKFDGATDFGFGPIGREEAPE